MKLQSALELSRDDPGSSRTYAADEILQIIDLLLAGGEIPQPDAAAMTRLVLLLKLLESIPVDGPPPSIQTAYRGITRFQEALDDARRAEVR